MGGEAVFIPGRPGAGEPAGDVARYLANWFDAIVIRTPEIETIEEMARNTAVPVINARTRQNHPCEILGDLAFVRECRGSLRDLRVVFVGEASNLGRSWFEAGVALPIEVVQVCPPGFEMDKGLFEEFKGGVAGSLRITDDLESALRDADVVYTDCWPGRTSADSVAAIERAFAPYRITAALLEQTPAACLFLPCPPVTRGEEVSADAMTSPKCRVYEAKEFLLHAQNALLGMLVG
jgi:ornithine carbamoyltransferase